MDVRTIFQCVTVASVKKNEKKKLLGHCSVDSNKNTSRSFHALTQWTRQPWFNYARATHSRLQSSRRKDFLKSYREAGTGQEGDSPLGHPSFLPRFLFSRSLMEPSVSRFLFPYLQNENSAFHRTLGQLRLSKQPRGIYFFDREF